jgi:hypothetical protein
MWHGLVSLRTESCCPTVGQEFDYFSDAAVVVIVIITSLCGLVVRITGYRSRGPGSTPGTTRFSEK